MRVPNSRHAQKGLTLIEALLSLAAFIFLIGLALTLGNVLTRQTSGIESSIWHSRLVDDAIKAYDPQNNCQGVSASTLVSLKAVPEEMLQGGQIIDAWGNPVQVSAATTVAANDTLVITYTGVAAEDCGSFAQQIEGKHFRIDVGGTTVKNTAAGIGYSVASAATACAGDNPKTFSMYTRCR